MARRSSPGGVLLERVELGAVPLVALDLQAAPELAVVEEAERHRLDRPDVGDHRRLPLEVDLRHRGDQPEGAGGAHPGALDDDPPAPRGDQPEAELGLASANPSAQRRLRHQPVREVERHRQRQPPRRRHLHRQHRLLLLADVEGAGHLDGGRDPRPPRRPERVHAQRQRQHSQVRRPDHPEPLGHHHRQQGDREAEGEEEDGAAGGTHQGWLIAAPPPARGSGRAPDRAPGRPPRRSGRGRRGGGAAA